MWEKAKQYLKKMGGVILLASIIIWALGYFPQTSTEIEQYQQDTQHYIADLDRQISLEDNQASKAQLLIERDSILNNIEQEISIRKQENSYIGRLGKFIEPIINVCFTSGLKYIFEAVLKFELVLLFINLLLFS